jgi:hypothetical protein
MHLAWGTLQKYYNVLKKLCGVVMRFFNKVKSFLIDLQGDFTG